jgi:hypothetical protein
VPPVTPLSLVKVTGAACAAPKARHKLPAAIHDFMMSISLEVVSQR